MNNAPHKNEIIEKVFQENFKNRSEAKIPAGWRLGLREQIRKVDENTVIDDDLLAKYENKFWRLAWLSFAASVIIFLSCMYFVNRDSSSLEETISARINQCLSVENQI